MKLIAAPNAFKGTLSAIAAAQAIVAGVHRVLPSADVVELPIADGGDGTRDVIANALGGARCERDVHDALGRPLRAAFALVHDGRTAVLDVASASGLALLTTDERDPLHASSFGTGELLAAALAASSERVLVGVGGSATVDGGMGLLAALGVRFFDERGHALAASGAALSRVARYELGALPARAGARDIVVLCDVDNPLLGPRGAVSVFAPQKGADAAAQAALSRGMENWCAVLERGTGRSFAALRRGGAAGGIATALHALLGARLVCGVDFVLDLLGFDELVNGAELVFTAEGRLDAQSLSEKGPFGVARRAQRAGVSTIVLAGSVADDLDIAATPFAAALSIQRAPADVAHARANAAPWLAFTAEQATRIHALRRDSAPPGGAEEDEVLRGLNRS